MTDIPDAPDKISSMKVSSQDQAVEQPELKECPFCSGEAHIERYGDARQSTVYACLDCGCRLETGEQSDYGPAWNTRDGDLRSRIAMLVCETHSTPASLLYSIMGAAGLDFGDAEEMDRQWAAFYKRESDFQAMLGDDEPEGA